MMHDAISGAMASFTLPSKGGYPDFTAQIRPEHVLAQSTPVSITGDTRSENSVVSEELRSEFFFLNPDLQLVVRWSPAYNE